MLPLDAGSGGVEAQVPSTQMVPEHPSDIVIANAFVHAVRAVPGVLDMGQGLFAKAATYGPGKHVSALCYIILHQKHARLRCMLFLRKLLSSKLTQKFLTQMHLP